MTGMSAPFGDPRLPARFWAKIEVSPDGCWVWTGAERGNGYSGFYWDHRSQYGHRVAYEVLVGPVVPGLDLDHLCRVRRCVNPLHLEAVTRQVNILRGMSVAAPRNRARKTHCVHGHEFTTENTYLKPNDGARQCRTCTTLRAERRYDQIRKNPKRKGTSTWTRRT